MGSSGDRQALADGVQGRSSQCDHPEISGWLLNPVPSILRKEETRRGHAGRRPRESGSREIGGGGGVQPPVQGHLEPPEGGRDKGSPGGSEGTQPCRGLSSTFPPCRTVRQPAGVVVAT